VSATPETLQDGLGKLKLGFEDLARRLDTLCLTTETVAKKEEELRQENAQIIQRLDTVCHNTEAIAKKEEVIVKNEEELRQENTEIRAGIDNLKQGVDKVQLNTEAIAKNESALRQEIAELRALAKAGFLRFATRVDPDDFRAFAAIMLTGNRYQAAKSLQIQQTAFYRRVESWSSRGGDYKRMYRVTEWRKKAGRKIKVRLDDSLLGTEVDGQAENPETASDVLESMRDKTDEKSRDDLLRDILQALCSQNADNWQSVRDELIEILKAEVPE
jgi:hypothetical protein